VEAKRLICVRKRGAEIETGEERIVESWDNSTTKMNAIPRIAFAWSLKGRMAMLRPMGQKLHRVIRSRFSPGNRVGKNGA